MSLLSVLGFGNVGQSLCRQATKTGVQIIAVADSSGALISNDISSGFSIAKLNKLSSLKANNKLCDCNTTNKEQFVSLSDIYSLLPYNSVLADCTASNNTTKDLIACQSNDIIVTMANKKPLTASFQEFEYLTSNRNLIGFSSTVGAGLPIITSLHRLLDSGDKIIKIQGQLSGTIGYIFSELQSGTMSFSECVKNAQKLGLTEPDPRDDLSGIDVARKGLILARCMGIEMELNDIKIDSLYPAEMEALSVEEFMANLHKLDNDMGHKILQAKNNGHRLRYVAVISRSKVEVGIVEIGINNALYNLVGTDNLVSMETELYGHHHPLVIVGPGGGVDIAASGVLADIYQIQGSHIKKQAVTPPKTN